MKILSFFADAGRYKRAVIAFITGIIASFSMAPYNIWPLLFFCLPIFYLLLDRTASVRGALFFGWMFGFGYFFAGLFWVKNALLVEGNDFFWMWPLATAGLPALLAGFFAVGAALAKRIVNFRSAWGFLTFTACMALVEWGRSFVFTGYPWNLFGYTWAGWLPMVQVVALGNVFYLTWLTIIWAALPALWIFSEPPKRHKIYVTVLAALSFLACFVFGAWRLMTTEIGTVPDIRIRAVQPNIAQSEKWERAKMGEHFLKTIGLSEPRESDYSGKTIIIWPETAMNYSLIDDPIAMKYLTDTLKSYEGETVLLTGLLRFTAEDKKFYNSMVMIDANGKISNSYDKHHLVPFGEYIPFQKWIPIKPVVAFNGFQKGSGIQTLEALGIKYSPVICYEIIFPGAVAGSDPPDLIVNITNDAWYGVSPGPYQHFTQAVFRAVEEGIPVIRIANTGFSAMIDPLGRVQDQSPLFKEYEKTLALPMKNVVFGHGRRIKNGFYLALILLVMSCNFYFRKN